MHVGRQRAGTRRARGRRGAVAHTMHTRGPAADSPYPPACMLAQPDGGIFDANVAFNQMMGYEDRQLIGNTIYMHVAPADIAPLMAQVCDLITGKVVRSRRAMRLQHKNGSVLGCTLDMRGERTAPDKMYIIVYAFQDNVDYCQQQHPQHIALDRLSLNDAPFRDMPAMGTVANHARPAAHASHTGWPSSCRRGHCSLLELAAADARTGKVGGCA